MFIFHVLICLPFFDLFYCSCFTCLVSKMIFDVFDFSCLDFFFLGLCLRFFVMMFFIFLGRGEGGSACCEFSWFVGFSW